MAGGTNKRKRAGGQSSSALAPPAKKPKPAPSQAQDRRRTRNQDARHISVQTAAFPASTSDVPTAINVPAFVASREFEIKALEDALSRSKDANMRRAFQLVPRSLRRRTGAHDVKRVPKRLRPRAQRDMKLDNVAAGVKKPSQVRGRKRLVVEEAKRRYGVVRVAREKRRERREGEKAEGKASRPDDGTASTEKRAKVPGAPRNQVKEASLPRGKFSKRQKEKSWLPTHVWHAKRAKMTGSNEPLWRMSIPLTPNDQCFRASQKAAGERGAIVWDTSYMSTIGLEGREESISHALRSLGVGNEAPKIWVKGSNWIRGTRSWSGWLHERGEPHAAICPATILWCADKTVVADLRNTSDAMDQPVEPAAKLKKPIRRKLIIRIHPAAFLEVWNTILPLAKQQQPPVNLEDLRFEIGSIEITGSSSMYALQKILKPLSSVAVQEESLGNRGAKPAEYTERWRTLRGASSAAVLPEGAAVGFSVADPRLDRSPIDPLDQSKAYENPEQQLQPFADWPFDHLPDSPALFSRKHRETASRQMPPQKAINRRREKNPLLDGPLPKVPSDPDIPVILLAHHHTQDHPASSPWKSSGAGQGSFTLLLPWVTVLHFWHALVHQPLNDGFGPPRFGGLDEYRQIHHARGLPWFPGDYPGTGAGKAWEARVCEERRKGWERKPRGRRTGWESVDVGGKKGEIGEGWACDWDRLLSGPLGETLQGAEKTREAVTIAINHSLSAPTTLKAGQSAPAANNKPDIEAPSSVSSEPLPSPNTTTQLTASQAISFLSRNPTTPTPPTSTHTFAHSPSPPSNLDSGYASEDLLSPPRPLLPSPSALATIRLSPLSRGVLQPCARIYRLPTTSPSLLNSWRSLAQAAQLPKSLALRPSSIHTLRRRNGMAGDFGGKELQVGELGYPACPGEEDLVGFVVSGEGLGGKSRGFGGVLLKRLIEGGRALGEEGGVGLARLVVWRNAGDGFGRLARWNVAE